MASRFNRRQRSALFLASGGHCAECGKLLEPGWHADHKQPSSHNGKTEIQNGQALCPQCNLKKGNRMSISLRECQMQFIDRGLAAMKHNQKVFLALLAPGAGKTLSGLCLADQAIAEGYIDTLVWLVPQKNLGNQVEKEWLKRRANLPWKHTMGDIDFRGNTPPLIRGGASGYITTYASLIAQPAIHKAALEGRRVM